MLLTHDKRMDQGDTGIDKYENLSRSLAVVSKNTGRVNLDQTRHSLRRIGFCRSVISANEREWKASRECRYCSKQLFANTEFIRGESW